MKETKAQKAEREEMNAYMIFEWCGRWAIPDDQHGGVRCGPHRSENEAREILETYAKLQANKWLEFTGEALSFEEEYNRVRSSHYIVGVTLPTASQEILKG